MRVCSELEHVQPVLWLVRPKRPYRIRTQQARPTLCCTQSLQNAAFPMPLRVDLGDVARRNQQRRIYRYYRCGNCGPYEAFQKQSRHEPPSVRPPANPNRSDAKSFVLIAGRHDHHGTFFVRCASDVIVQFELAATTLPTDRRWQIVMGSQPTPREPDLHLSRLSIFVRPLPLTV
jgi:hypothetical protein